MREEGRTPREEWGVVKEIPPATQARKRPNQLGSVKMYFPGRRHGEFQMHLSQYNIRRGLLDSQKQTLDTNPGIASNIHKQMLL